VSGPVVPPDRIRLAPGGDGWYEAVLADAEVIGAPAMVLRLVRIDPGAGTGERARRGSEEFLYVIRGDGAAIVGDATEPLAPETVLWLEEGDDYRLVAGGEGLEVLIASSGDP